MERRLFLAVSLCILVLYLYQAFLVPPSPPGPAAGKQAAPAATGAPSPAPGPAAATAPPGTATSAATNTANVQEPPLETEAPAAVVSASVERQIVVNTGRVEAVLTNQGGRVIHWRLLDYPDPDGDPVDLVPSNIPAEQPRPFSLAVDDPRLTARLNRALYRVAGDVADRVDGRQSPAVVAFEYEDAGGLRARKEFRFEPDGYIVTFSADVAQGGSPLNPAVQFGPGLGDLGATTAGGSFFTGNYVQPPSAIYNESGSVKRVAPKKLGETPTYNGTFLFAGIDDHYFLAAALEPGQARFDFSPITLAGSDGTSRQLVAQSVRPPQPKPLRFFIGPKELETLRRVGLGGELANAINFGMFYWLVVPLLESLKWVHRFIGNYGWAIIILTILINLVMFPLRHKSLVSMRKMQALQPKIKSIQDRYADLKITDPARQKMNTEIMNLYRENGANPAAGCVPMLLTMPVLLAFYSMLSQAIELRGADFGLWIHDLSMKDPFYITPLLMGATMFWQMRMSPTTADPTQQRMMMFMPIVFTVMFLRFPSGLAIYYLVSNLCQIGQQYFTNRTIRPPALAPIRNPARGGQAGGR